MDVFIHYGIAAGMQAFRDAGLSVTESNAERIGVNVGSGIGTSLNDLVQAIGEVVGRPVQCNYLPGRAIDVPVSVLDCSLAKREFGWSPAVTLPSGLAATVAWLRLQ